MKLIKIIFVSLFISLFLFLLSVIFSYREVDCGTGSCGFFSITQPRENVLCPASCIRTFNLGWPWKFWIMGYNNLQNQFYIDNLIADFISYFIFSSLFVLIILIKIKKLFLFETPRLIIYFLSLVLGSLVTIYSKNTILWRIFGIQGHGFPFPWIINCKVNFNFSDWIVFSPPIALCGSTFNWSIFAADTLIIFFIVVIIFEIAKLIEKKAIYRTRK